MLDLQCSNTAMPHWRIYSSIFILASALAGIVYLFWSQQLQYLLPTPAPAGYQPVAKEVSLSELPESLNTVDRPYLLLHFFNPDCPCSRFNLKHLRQLHHEFSGQLNITLVIPYWADSAKAIQMADFAKYLYVDTDLSLSKKCGVYSTPQAVLMGPEGKSLYTGNYNTSRYCGNKETEYVRLALEASIHGQKTTEIQGAPAYGCPFYSCETSPSPSILSIL
jgi:hypothetical protein